MPSKPVPASPKFSRSPDQRGAIQQKFIDGIGADVVPVDAYPLLATDPYSIEETDSRLQQRAGPGK